MTYRGRAGDDILIGGLDIDFMFGGTGDDLYEVDDAGDQVSELANEGTDTVVTTLSSYLLSDNVELLSFAGIGSFNGTGNVLDNVITGGSDNDVIVGLAGNDVLNGGLGSDYLAGGEGIDTMAGGVGNDFYAVDNAGDMVIELAGEGADLVRTSLSDYTLGENVEHLVYTGVGAFTGNGNDLANTIIGGAGNDILNGGAGNDVLRGNDGSDLLFGGAGVDLMFGGDGNDFYYVDDVADVVTELAGEGADLVRTTLSSYTLGASVEHLVYIGAGSFTGTGNDLNNTLIGGDGNDSLNADAGNDVLIGGQGDDTLTGGDGVDIFMFGVGFGNDLVLEFDADPAGGQDFLHIAGLGITSADFAANVNFADDGMDTVVSIGGDSIRLAGINDATLLTQADFILA
jgi:Ca2+-binding RTX toxin-like protein